MLRKSVLLAFVLLIAAGSAFGQNALPTDDTPPIRWTHSSFQSPITDEPVLPSQPLPVTSEGLASEEDGGFAGSQRTWGQAGVFGYATGRKVAPNGEVYDPLFALDLLLNISLTRDRSWYLFTDSRFWGQKAADGVTNSSQGVLDFSKRQFDLDGGVAWHYSGPWEARAFAYSQNNLNRGTSLDIPYGYNDGFALENRYYFESTSFDKGLYRFLSLGYYVTKDLIGGDQKEFEPSLFARANLALDIVPDQCYLFSDMQFITRRPVMAKLLLADVGVAVRPFSQIPDLEFRVGVDFNYDMQAGILRNLVYGNVRIIW